MVEPASSSKLQDKQSSPSSGVILAYLTCIFIWGTTWNAVRLCVLPGGLEPYTAATVRFGFAAAFLCALVMCGIFRIRLQNKKSALWVIITSLTSVISMALVYNAQKSVSGGIAAILATTSPLMMAVLATMTRTEKVSAASIIGAIVSVVGIGVIFGDRLNVSANQAVGILLLIGSVMINSTNSLLLKRFASGENPFVYVSLFVVVSLLCFSGLGASFEHTNWQTVNPISIAASAYLGIVGSVVAFACFFYLLKRVRLMTISSMVFFPPLIAMMVDGFIEHEVHLNATSYAGIGITVLGVVIGVLIKPPKTKKPAPQPSEAEPVTIEAARECSAVVCAGGRQAKDSRSEGAVY